MGPCVCNGAQLMCTFGAAPGSLIVPPAKRVMAPQPAATVTDSVPMVNIMPFGMCSCPANPATVKPPPVFFAPAPCMPVIPAPWAPGCPSVLIGGVPALDSMAKCMCAWGGVIQVVNPGQTKAILGNTKH